MRRNRLELNPAHLTLHEDWEGGAVAFTCPLCNNVFIVSEEAHGGSRACTNCGKSNGHVSGAKASGGKAWLVWS